MKEIYRKIKTNKVFKENEFLDFTLALFIIGKIVSNEYSDSKKVNNCKLCQSSVSELMKIEENEVLIFLNEYLNDFCYVHSMVYLDLRKSHGLIGKRLLLGIKMFDQ